MGHFMRSKYTSKAMSNLLLQENHTVMQLTTSYDQARRQDLAAGGAKKTERRAKSQKGGAHF